MPRLWIVVFILFIAFSAIASEITGKVVGISDGDPFTLLLVNNTTVRIRLHGIDTPEKGQPFGNNANQVTSRCIIDFVAVSQIDGCICKEREAFNALKLTVKRIKRS